MTDPPTAVQSSIAMGGRRRTSVSLPWIDTLAVAAVTTGIIFFVGGIDIGYTNQVGMLPLVRRLLDPAYLPGDFGIKIWLYHHRAFADVTAWLATLIGLDRALILLSILGTAALSTALYAICRLLRLPLTVYLFAGAFVAIHALWTGLGLEENTLIGDREAYPTTIAHTLVLFAIAAVMTRRYRAAAFCAGLTFLFHLQIGAILVLLLAPFYVFSSFRPGPKEILICISAWLSAGFFGLLQIWEIAQRGVFGPEFSRFFVEFRMPHHVELQSLESLVWVGGQLAIQIACYTWLRRIGRPEADRIAVLLALSGLLAAFCVAHFIEYYCTNSVTLLRFQFPRLSPLITLFGLLALLTAINAWRERASRKEQMWRTSVAWTSLVVVLGCQFSHLLASGNLQSGFRINRFADDPSAWASMCRWIDRNAPQDTLYLTPPANEGFTYLAQRSTVVEYKIDPDGAQLMTEWFTRLRDMSGGILPNGHGWDNAAALNKAYGNLTGPQLVALGHKYGAHYAVLPRSSPVDFDVLSQNGEYRLVRLPN